MLDTAIGLPHWRDRRSLIVGIREAFIRLGPQASAATPRIRELFLRRPSPITSNAGDATQWRFALARMGVQIEDLPVFPNQSPQSVQRDLRREPTRSSGMNGTTQRRKKSDRQLTLPAGQLQSACRFDGRDVEVQRPAVDPSGPSRSRCR